MFFSTPSPIAEAAPEVAQKRAIVRAISAHSPAQRHKKAAYRAFFAQYAAFFYLTGILHALTSLRSKASQSSAAHGYVTHKVPPCGIAAAVGDEKDATGVFFNAPTSENTHYVLQV